MKTIIFTTRNLPGIISIEAFVKKHPEAISSIIVFPAVPKSMSDKKEKFLSFLLKIPFSLLFYKILETKIFYALRVITGGSTPFSLGAHRGIPVMEFNGPNEKDCLDYLMGQKPDVIFNFSPSIMKEKVLSLPKIACVNFHGAPLPEWKGVANYFWVLIEGATQSGSTAHVMELGLDKGDIVGEKRFEIDSNDTVNSINFKSALASADILEGLFLNLTMGELTRKVQDESKAKYRSFPTKQEVKALKKFGRKVFTLSDFFRAVTYKAGAGPG